MQQTLFLLKALAFPVSEYFTRLTELLWIYITLPTACNPEVQNEMRTCRDRAPQSFFLFFRGSKTVTREDKVGENERIYKRKKKEKKKGAQHLSHADLGKVQMMSPRCTDCSPERNLSRSASTICTLLNLWLIWAAGVHRVLSSLALGPAQPHRELSVNTWLTLEIISH